MNAKPLVFAAAGYLLYRAANKAWGATRLNYFLQRPSVRMDGWTPVVYLPVAVQNVSSASYTLRGFTGTLYANGYEVSNISNFQLVVIKPHAQTTVTIDARLHLISIAWDLFNILSGSGGLSQEITLTGTANVEGVPIPIGPLKYKLL